jgi:hypothetical protein
MMMTDVRERHTEKRERVSAVVCVLGRYGDGVALTFAGLADNAVSLACSVDDI